MNALSSLRIGTRLGLSFAIVLALMLVMAAAGVLQLRQIAALNAERNELAQRATDIEQWQGAVTLNLTRALGVGASGYHAPTVAFLEPPMKETSAVITKLQDSIDKSLTDPRDRALFDDVGVKRKTYVDVRAKAAAAFKAGNADEGNQLVAGPMTAGAKAYLDAIAALQGQVQASADALGAEAARRSQQAQTLVLVLALAALLIGSAMAWRITLSVTRPLRQAIDTAERIADKDLSVPTSSVTRGDEIGALQRALAKMQGSLTEMVQQIRTGTVGVAGASSEIAAASTDLSQRTEETSGSLQQTASAMEQITATVNQTAESARTANQLAASATDVARRGGTVVSQVVSTMDEINASSKQISDIIGTIDGIAFQTNILALNAAVEAARAGEQGRGFAVVASEVRSLAQRSAEAAKQIKTLIGTSVERVESGTRLVSDAGSTMGEIVASVQRVSDIIGEVMAAAGEQSQGIAQVNGSVATLDQMTQQNAALVEESAAAAESLKDQAEKLAALVATFRLGAQAAPVAAAAIAQARHAGPVAAPRAATPAPAPATARAAPARATAPARTAPAPRAPLAAPAKAALTPAAAPASTASDDQWETF
ncbi:methyl-accepting chemotaxis protein [Rubrivivax sp. RP6-9]|uniref:methyl-accepting chemotaxis protein n=1 Tax=Rubrivivax sp. RP6-9 TaxID=3415750 RepID=UPI003CC582A6